MTDLVEISALWRAQSFGEIEPLLDLFERQGLTDPAARKLVADLARGKSLRKPGQRIRTFNDEHREHVICMLVANRMGLLKRAGRDQRRAFKHVSDALQCVGDTLDPRQVKNIWNNRNRNGYDTMAFELGQSGITVTPEPEIS